MEENNECEVSIRCHIYLPIKNKEEAEEKINWLYMLADKEGFMVQDYETEINEL